jgi:hypothetical protein
MLNFSVAGNDRPYEGLDLRGGGSGFLQEPPHIGKAVEILPKGSILAVIEDVGEVLDADRKAPPDGLQDSVVLQFANLDGRCGVMTAQPKQALKGEGSKLVAGFELLDTLNGFPKILGLVFSFQRAPNPFEPIKLGFLVVLWWVLQQKPGGTRSNRVSVQSLMQALGLADLYLGPDVSPLAPNFQSCQRDFAIVENRPVQAVR